MRTFIAVKLPSEVKEKIEKTVDPFRKLGLDISWVKPKNLHLTLKFLGDVDEKRIQDVILALEHALKEREKLTMSLRDFGVFPDFKKPRVIWIGIEKGKEDLIRIQDEIQEELFKVGFSKEERGFSPHLTIARVKSPRGIEKLTGQIKDVNFESEEIRVEEVILMKSQLHPQGAIYTPIRTFTLK